MIPFNEIKIGKADAINYYRGSNKEFLNKVFYNDEKLKEILEEKNTFY